MKYAVNCSLTEISDFSYALSENYGRVGALVDEAVNAYEAIVHNYQCVEAMYMLASKAINEDLLEIDIVLKYNRDVKEKAFSKIKQEESRIGSAQSELKSNEAKLRESMEKGDMNAVKKAKESCGSAAQVCGQAEQQLAYYRRIYDQAVQVIAVLEKMQWDINVKRQANDRYLEECKFRLRTISDAMSELKDRYKRLAVKCKQLDEIAGKAAEYIKAAGKNFALASDSDYNEFNEVRITSVRPLIEFANLISFTGGKICDMDSTLEYTTHDFGDVLQDEVTRGAVSEITKRNAAINLRTEDFNEKGNRLKNAAVYLQKYIELY